MTEQSVLSTDALRRFVGLLATAGPGADDADRVDRLRLLEQLKAAAAAAQAVEAVTLDRSQRAKQAGARVPTAQQGRGVAAQVALARRVSPWAATRWLGWAKILTSELPGTLAALRAGRTTEWRAMLMARETAGLSRADRAAVDAELAPRLEHWGDRRVEGEARRAAYRLDPGAAVARRARAEADRTVWLRPAPDTMCRLTTLVPVAQGVAAYAALCRAADTHVASAGDPRTRGQVLADTAIARLTGQAAAPDVPVEVVVQLDASTLLGGDEPAHLHGYGPIPADLARHLALRDAAPHWLRRVFVRPEDGELVALESRRRRFTPGQQRFLRLRDQTCRTSWCDAPIRHADHVRPHGRGGQTSVGNGRGLCVACNHSVQAYQWLAQSLGNGTIVTHTPTGHRYHSRAPDPPGRPPDRWCRGPIRVDTGWFHAA